MGRKAAATLEEVRREVLDQHVVLRTLLRETLDVTTRALKDHKEERAELEVLTRELRNRFRAHLRFEEHQLVPLLVEAHGWGDLHVRELHEEHARQRAELDTLIGGIEGGWDAGRLALTLRSLATELFIDMSGEERALERPAVPLEGAIAGDNLAR